jgi:hypothetical protein
MIIDEKILKEISGECTKILRDVSDLLSYSSKEIVVKSSNELLKRALYIREILKEKEEK